MCIFVNNNSYTYYYIYVLIYDILRKILYPQNEILEMDGNKYFYFHI